MMYGYGYGPIGMGIFGGLLSLVFWVAIIWLILGLIRGHRHHCMFGECGHEGDGKKSDSAMEVLRERFAKGEISKDEFEQMSQVLKNS